MLRRLAITSVEQCICRRHSRRRRRFRIGHYRHERSNCLCRMFSRKLLYLGDDLGPSAWVAALTLLKWFSNCHAVSLLIVMLFPCCCEPSLSAVWEPTVTFHSIRHCHASALIKGGIDVVSVSRRLGHSSPVVTLKVYAHLFGVGVDIDAANAIERMIHRCQSGANSTICSTQEPGISGLFCRL